MEELVTISFGSINTGLPKDIVKQLMDAERVPVQKMEAGKTKFEDKKKLVAELTKLVDDVKVTASALVDERGLKELKVDCNNELISVDLDKEIAQPGSYQFEVARMAQKSSAFSSGFPDRDETSVGVGFVQYTLPTGESLDLYIDKDNSTLDGLAKLINDRKIKGVRATVINDGFGTDDPWRLMISLKDTGDDYLAEFPYFYFVDGDRDFYLEHEREAHDALVKLDGFEIELPINKTKDLITGATINLKKASEGEEFTILISEDIPAMTDKMNDLIEKINAVLTFIIKQNTLDDKSDTSRTLGGDVTLQSLESRLRSIVFKDVKTELGEKKVGSLGITFQKNGTLLLDKKKFSSSLTADLRLAMEILTGARDEESGTMSPGFIDNIAKLVHGILRAPDGMLPNRKTGLQTNIDQINKRIDDKQRLLEQKESNLKDKFARLESTISKLKGQSAGLSALAAQASNPVTQLG